MVLNSNWLKRSTTDGNTLKLYIKAMAAQNPRKYGEMRKMFNKYFPRSPELRKYDDQFTGLRFWKKKFLKFEKTSHKSFLYFSSIFTELFEILLDFSSIFSLSIFTRFFEWLKWG